MNDTTSRPLTRRSILRAAAATTATGAAALALPSRADAAPMSLTSMLYDCLVQSHRPVGYWPLTGHAADRSGRRASARLMGGAGFGATTPDAAPALLLNGLDQYAEVANQAAYSVTATGRLTVEAWVRPDTLQFPRSEDTGYVHWMGKCTYDVVNQCEYVARLYDLTNAEGRPNRFSGYAFNPRGGWGTGSYFQNPVTVGEWIHFVMVISTAPCPGYDDPACPGYTKVYRNGAFMDQDALANYRVVPQATTAPFRLGTVSFDSFFRGAISRVAIYPYELSPRQVLTHYRTLVPA